MLSCFAGRRRRRPLCLDRSSSWSMSCHYRRSSTNTFPLLNSSSNLRNRRSRVGKFANHFFFAKSIMYSGAQLGLVHRELPLDDNYRLPAPFPLSLSLSLTRSLAHSNSQANRINSSGHLSFLLLKQCSLHQTANSSSNRKGERVQVGLLSSLVN